jgi:hypothetical protein
VDGGTGFPSADAQDDFSRARRSQLLADLGRRLRREPDDVALILPFDEVVDALGMVGEVQLGLQTIPLDSIVGTVDRTRDFDRGFRPTTPRVRGRWQRIAAAQRRGESFPPISVYRIGDLHFVDDGHHRVSVARELGLETIDAYVTEIITAVGADEAIEVRDLALKSHERLFYERVPLPAHARERIKLPNRSLYAGLAEGVEAWGARLMHAERAYLDRAEIAGRWFADEYVPVVEMLKEADLIGRNTETEAYIKVGSLRYMLLRTHEWNEDVIERLRAELSRPLPREEDTLEHMMRSGLGR